jgi:hypothetical protein
MKLLSPDAVPSALEKALRYRMLNEPEQAVSICEDVLRVEPDNQDAVAMLILSITDRFCGPRPAPPKSAHDLLPRLRGDYERAYYAGIIWERDALARLRANVPHAGRAAFECFRRAMESYERAESLRPHGNDDALLRWNSCARMIMSHPDVTPSDERVEVSASLGE